ncbi:MAG: SDR family NAD(P)-dependent oxidoreductase [Desulfobacterales bacterium]|nr:SDR family NAD(P)-dependent oxidoreductase [Desulfobacterales bacterium]
MHNEKKNIADILTLLKNRKISIDEGIRIIGDIKQKRNIESEPVFYTPYFEKSPISINGDTDLSESCIIFDKDSILKNELEKKFNKTKFVLVKEGKEFNQLENLIFEINSYTIEHYSSLIKAFKKQSIVPNKIIHNWSKSESLNEDYLYKSLYSIFFLTSALLTEKFNNDCRLIYVYSSDSPICGSISGFAKTIYKENPKFKYKSIQILNSSKHTDIIANELKNNYNSPEDIFYNENGERFVKNLKITDLKEREQQIAINKENGVYIITGGAGGLGLIFTEYLAQNKKVNLILSGRSDLNSEKKSKIDSLKALGTNIEYIKSDVSIKKDAEFLINEAISKFGKINGIIHSAGINKDSFMIKKNFDEFKKVIAPKIYGTIYLDEALGQIPIDFFVLFSSLASVFGNQGQADYASANSFLDYYAQFRNSLVENKEKTGKTISINWPLWDEGGMQISEQDRKILFDQSGIIPLPTNIGLTAFDSILNARLSQAIVLYGHPQKLDDYVNKKITAISDTVEKKQPAKIDEKALTNRTEVFLKSIVSEGINLPEDKLDVQVRFEEYGIDSIIIKHLNLKLEEKLGSLPKTLFFEYQTLKELTDYFVNNYAERLSSILGLKDDTAIETKADVKKEIPHFQILKQILTPRKKRSRFFPESSGFQQNVQDIAIIGMSGRYPLAKNIDEFWKNLSEGKDCITEVPKNRWDVSEYYDSDIEKAKEGKMYCKWGGFIDDIDKFDPLFFSISPRDAELMDPQERIFLESVWHAFEDAGYNIYKLSRYIKKPNPQSVGVFVGITTNSYQLIGVDNWNKGAKIMPSSYPWSIANRISYTFNFNGPSIPIDTACSSSLTAIHLACESLKKGECNLAVAGGVNLYLHPSKYVGMCQIKMLSKKGRCHTFGFDADGFVPGEGVGSIILKPLEDAINDNDNIYGVIKGSFVNHGGRTHGFTVPNPNAQAEVIIKALENANIDARTISFIEAHGTGTSLGDPVEITGLTKAFQKFTKDINFCSISSSKSNIGHLESGAGIAGITKILLQMRHKKLVPSLHCEKLNPNINFENTPLRVQKNLEDWKQPVIYDDNGKETILKRRAGISSFGAGGANAHIIIEEYEQETLSKAKNTEIFIIPLSAKNEDSLKNYANIISEYIEANNVELEDIAYTLQTGRFEFDVRIAVIASSKAELCDILNKFSLGQKNVEGLYIGNTNQDKTKSLMLIDGEEGREFFRIILEQKKLFKIAQLWTSGIDIDWEFLYSDKTHRKAHLPGYPFKGRRFWLEPEISQISSHIKKINLHPLVGLNTSTFQEEKFTTFFSGNEFFFEDHQVLADKVFPGAAYIEMARSAGCFASEKQVTKLTNIVWLRPMIMSDKGIKAEIILSPEDDGAYYEICTEIDNSRVIHSKGMMLFQKSSQASKPLEIESIKNRCLSSMEPSECYQIFQSMGLNYGTNFNVIKSLHFNQQECICFLEISSSSVNKDFVLHPALLDGSIQSLIGLMENKNEKQPYLPFSLDGIEIFAPLTSKCIAYSYETSGLKESNIKKFDILIADEYGNMLTKIKNFTVRKLESKQADDAYELNYFMPVWTEIPVNLALDAVLEKIFVFDNFDESSSIYGDYIKSLSDKIQNYHRTVFSLNKFSKNDYLSALRGIEDISETIRIIHFFPTIDPNVLDESINIYIEKSIYSILYLSQVIFEKRLKTPVEILCVFFNNGESNPFYKAISGFARTGFLENSKILIKTIEIKSDKLSFQKVFGLLLNEFCEESSNDFEVLLENDIRRVKQIKPIETSKNKETIELKEDGVYLITGGAGGIGLIMTKYLFEKAKCQIVLCGRSSLSSTNQTKIDDLKALGAKIHYIQADIANYKDVEMLVLDIKKKFNKLNGVIHAAGVIRDKLIINQTEKDTEDVIKPKVHGIIYLDDLLKDEELDFFALFSSLAGITGNIGQSVYAYSNAFLNTFAEIRENLRKRNMRKGVTVSYSWPLWKEGGMNINDSLRADLKQRLGIIPLSTDNGIKAFECGLNLEISNIIPVEGNKQKIINALSKVAKKIKPSEAIKSESKNEAIGGKEDFKEKIFSHIRAIFCEVLKITESEIIDTATFEQYGIDSLLGAEIIKRLEVDFGKLPATILFEYMTIEKLCEYFLDEHRDKLASMFKISSNVLKVDDDNKFKNIQQEVNYLPADNNDPFDKLLNSLDDSDIDDLLKMLND